ncbi:MAG: epoxyqueuosine reductase [Candidatus Bathyarchaeota archaeon]|nr:epoxyqueuosine reductase [Candidatus Bathyarchaeota archaeon]
MNINHKGEWIEKIVKDYIAGPENTLEKWDDEPAWAEPIVGFSSGADPLYTFYKKDIGSFYVMPDEFLSHAYPDKQFDAAKLTVISWILPQTEATKHDHRKETHFPSERWARSRILGEKVNVKLREHVVQALNDAGIEAVAPMLSPLWKGATSEKYLYASTWSERHAAYAAGLGTFGLSDALITPKGMAHRAGSVVANIKITPSERVYENHNAYCLFLVNGSCGKCIERCPIGAITEKGHDKQLCNKYVAMTRKYVSRHYAFDGYGCGFCQTDVPCESGIPESLKIL